MRRHTLLAIWLLSNSLPPFLRADVMSVHSATQAVGDSFSIPVVISGATDLYAYQFDLSFNAAMLQLQSIDEGTLLASAGSTLFIPGSIDNIAGTATFTVATLLGPGPGAVGNGTLATFDFLAKAVGNSSLDLSNVILLNSGLDDIDFTTDSGSVSVIAGPVSGVPEPGSLWLLVAVIGIVSALKSNSLTSFRKSGWPLRTK